MECVETELSMPLIVPTVWTVVLDFFRFFEYAKGDAKSRCVLYFFERFYCSQTFQHERCSNGFMAGL